MLIRPTAPTNRDFTILASSSPRLALAIQNKHADERILRASFGDVLTHYYPTLDACVARYRSELATEDQFKAVTA